MVSLGDLFTSKKDPNGKKDKCNKAATKWTDSKQSWQHFPKKVGIKT